MTVLRQGFRLHKRRRPNVPAAKRPAPYWHRSQYVCLRGTSSNTSIITCRVPQRSILGPILFLLYINDLSLISPSLKFILFADDTNVFLSHKPLDKLLELMNAELINISEWFNINKLSLNSEKTNYIVFSSAQKKISLNNTP